MDDMFIAAEMENRKREIAEMEKDKVRVEFHMRRDTALIILDRLDHKSDGNVARLTNKELEVLLRWKGVPVSKMATRLASERYINSLLVTEERMTWVTLLVGQRWTTTI